MEENIDFSEAFDKIQEMFKSDEGKKQLQGIFDMFSGDGPSSDSHEDDEDSLGFDFDPAMLLKLQKILSAANRREQNEKARLLLAIKPFLRENRQSKVDNAIKLMNISGVLSVFKEK